jgi:hypothetical protein
MWETPLGMRQREREWARNVYKAFHLWRPGAKYVERYFRDWLASVQEIKVELHPGARATLEHPTEDVDVEIRWDPTTRPLFATSFRVSAKPGYSLPWAEHQFSHYFAALGLALMAANVKRTPAATVERPAAGRPPSMGHYRAVVDEYNRLINEGHPSPVNEIARRYGVKPGTVKSWRSRGQRYMREGRK